VRSSALALILIGLLLLAVAVLFYLMPHPAEGESGIGNDSPPGGGGGSTTSSPPSSTTTAPAGARIAGGIFRVRLLGPEGKVLRSGSRLLSVFVDPGRTKNISKVAGEVEVNLEGSGQLDYVVEVYVRLTMVGSGGGPEPQPTLPPSYTEPVPYAVVGAPINYGTYRIVLKEGRTAPESLKVPWEVPASQIFGGLPDGEFEATFWCKVTVMDSSYYMDQKFSGPVAFTVYTSGEYVEWGG